MLKARDASRLLATPDGGAWASACLLGVSTLGSTRPIALSTVPLLFATLVAPRDTGYLLPSRLLFEPSTTIASLLSFQATLSSFPPSVPPHLVVFSSLLYALPTLAASDWLFPSWLLNLCPSW